MLAGNKVNMLAPGRSGLQIRLKPLQNQTLAPELTLRHIENDWWMSERLIGPWGGGAMTLAELRAAAGAKSPLNGQPVAHIYLTLHRTTLPRSRDVRLTGRAGLLGRPCIVKEVKGGGYACVAACRVIDVLALCNRLKT